MLMLGSLIVAKGQPYSPNYKIELNNEQIILGRESQAFRPDISFSSPHVSRKHATITYDGGLYFIADLSSKHGTTVNQTNLVAGQPCPLHNGDIISLAKGIIQLHFICLDIDGATTDLTTNLALTHPPAHNVPIIIDSQRREIIIDGKHILLQGKEMELLIILFENKSRAVSYDEIRQSVWPERPEGIIPGVPDVDTNEITTLVYRLRQKLGKFDKKIATVPRYGYRLDL